MQIGVIGVGSIGTTLARAFDRLGHTVYINDIDLQRLSNLEFEPKTKAEINNECDIAVFALPTPTRATGGDPSIVETALQEFDSTGPTLVIRSTMPPGTTQILADLYDLDLVYSPEFLRDRATVDDFFDMDRLVISGPKPEREVVRDLFTHPDIDCGQVIELDDYITAEIGKEAHNAFFATKVSFANQIREICEAEDADARAAMEIVTADARTTDSHLDPMLGPYGGRCLPKDTEALRLYGIGEKVETPVLDGVKKMNEFAELEWENKEVSGDWPEIEVKEASDEAASDD